MPRITGGSNHGGLGRRWRQRFGANEKSALMAISPLRAVIALSALFAILMFLPATDSVAAQTCGTTTTVAPTTTIPGAATTTTIVAPTTTTTAAVCSATTTTVAPTTTTSAAPITTTTAAPIITTTVAPTVSATVAQKASQIPAGSPQTGAGGAAGSTDSGPLLVLSGLAIFAGFAAMGLALRRRRA